MAEVTLAKSDTLSVVGQFDVYTGTLQPSDNSQAFSAEGRTYAWVQQTAGTASGVHFEGSLDGGTTWFQIPHGNGTMANQAGSQGTGNAENYLTKLTPLYRVLNEDSTSAATATVYVSIHKAQVRISGR